MSGQAQRLDPADATTHRQAAQKRRLFSEALLIAAAAAAVWPLSVCYASGPSAIYELHYLLQAACRHGKQLPLLQAPCYAAGDPPLQGSPCSAAGRTHGAPDHAAAALCSQQCVVAKGAVHALALVGRHCSLLHDHCWTAGAGPLHEGDVAVAGVDQQIWHGRCGANHVVVAAVDHRALHVHAEVAACVAAAGVDC